ncbi:hypothetical protein [Pelagibacterium montanilacus]|uniref:hypothetical protein n=1 Tax=Pelagibacterium montanilacus TaxID=2185280 RepID=UPI000F8D31CB|nr:hypothetical protein [Pelagibacterium montanilacus]
MTATSRLAVLDEMDAPTLCMKTQTALSALVEVMNRETTLLRAGHMREATAMSAEKAQLAQDYVQLARAVQRHTPRLRAEAPERIAALARGHEALATQMAENLRVLATARAVTEDLLGDVARQAAGSSAPRTYGASGAAPATAQRAMEGISVNRAL